MSTWLPGIVVLLGGLIAGLVTAFRMSGSGPKESSQGDDRRLWIDDLRARRDELYARLGDTNLSDIERDKLERSAAHTLRELDKLGALGPEGQSDAPISAKPPAKARASKAATSKAATSFAARHPALSGFLLGAGGVGLLVLLVVFAMRDSGIMKEEAAAQTPPHAMPQEQGGPPPIPPEIQAEMSSLQATIDTNPDDLGARNDLAHLLIESGRYYDAFTLSDSVLARDPKNIEARTHKAVVHFVINQKEQALVLMDGVLKDDGDFVEALGWRGLFYARMGDLDQAVALWQHGVEVSGGSHPALEHLIQQAEGGGMSAPPADHPEHEDHEDPMNTDSTFPVHIELAQGVHVPEGAVLFVFLRTGEGAPVLVKRMNNYSFPLDLTLTEADRMMEVAIPSSGSLTVRIDGDGNVGTKNDTVAAAEVLATAGRPSTVTLKP